MKNLILTFLVALLVVWTAISVRRIVAGNLPSTGQRPTLVAIGVEPVPPFPPHVQQAGGGHSAKLR